jgi:hypothetical protein
MQKILHFDGLDPKYFAFRQPRSKSFGFDSSMQNPLDFIGHGGPGLCMTPSLDRRSLPSTLAVLNADDATLKLEENRPDWVGFVGIMECLINWFAVKQRT